MGYSFQDLGGGAYRVSGVRISPTTGKYITHKEETMTDTTQVPTALLERLRDNITRRTNDGWVQETYISGTVVQELIALIPAAPAQVGDKPTASQIRALPLRTLLRDPDGDIYVIGEDVDGKQKIIGVLNDDFETFADEYTPEQVALHSSVIIALPEEEK